MKPSKMTYERMKNMLVRDKLGVSNGFMQVYKTELSRLTADYFNLDGNLDMKIELLDGGEYKVQIEFVATETKGFSVTSDMKRAGW